MDEDLRTVVAAPASTRTVLLLFALALEATVHASHPWPTIPVGVVVMSFLTWLFVGPPVLPAAMIVGLVLGEGLGAALSAPPAMLFIGVGHAAPWLSYPLWTLRIGALAAAAFALGSSFDGPARSGATALAAGLGVLLVSAVPGALAGRQRVDTELRDHVAEQLGPAYAGYELYVVDKDWIGTADAWIHRYDVIAYGDRDARRLTVEWTTPRTAEDR